MYIVDKGVFHWGLNCFLYVVDVININFADMKELKRFLKKQIGSGQGMLIKTFHFYFKKKKKN